MRRRRTVCTGDRLMMCDLRNFRYAPSHFTFTFDRNKLTRHFSQTVELVCGCNTPANPDKLLVGCSSESCKKWLHEECIKDQALRATFERLGTDKPHIPVKEEKVDKKEEDNDEDAKAKTEPNGVDVKAEKGVNGATNGNRALKAGDEDATEADAAETDTSGLALRFTRRTRTPSAKAKSATPAPATAPTSTSASTTTSTAKTIKTEPAPAKKGPGRPRKQPKSLLPAAAAKEGAKVTNKERPWEGLFSVTLEMDGTPYLEFTDLRTDVVENKGGAKTWRETIKCLVCGELVN